MRLYYLMGTLLRPFATIALHVYSYLLRSPRARLVVRNEHDEVLLLQTWLGGGTWGLPGGGIERMEDPVDAAVRELREETGIEVAPGELQSLFTLRSAGHEEIVYALSVSSRSMPPELPNRFEIKSAAWFSLDALPHLEPLAGRIISRL